MTDACRMITSHHRNQPRFGRIALLSGIAGWTLRAAIAGLTLVPTARAASPSEMGSWGQAWGDDTQAVPTAQGSDRFARTPRPARPAATPDTPPAAQPPAIEPMQSYTAGPSANDIGGWGNAWGDTVPASPPSRQTGRTVAQPTQQSQPAAAAPLPVQTVATASPMTTPSQSLSAEAVNAGLLLPISDTSTSQPAQQPRQPAIGQSDGLRGGKTGSNTNEPVRINADQIVHDQELGIVTARGRVEIIQSNRSLTADQVTYNIKQDVVSATGNVAMLEASGEVVFSDYFELTGDMKDGVAQEIHMILADNSRVGAASAQRTGGVRTDFDKAVYTACEPCREDPTRRPLWEAKAERVTHNQSTHQVEYRDAWLELAGIPVAYTPYLSHPDPTVKRKSGILIPAVGMSSSLGTNVTVPYFWAIKDNQDITFMPRFLFPKHSEYDGIEDLGQGALQRMVLAGEHRWAGREGETTTIASLTADRYDGDLRGHLDAKGRFDLNSTWRAGYQVQLASDDTYNAIYGYPIQADRPWLTTRPYLEGFGRQNYALAEGFGFQGLRSSDKQSEAPIVLPHMAYSYVSMPDSGGGYWSMDNDLLSYTRRNGVDAARVSTTAAWQRPFQSRIGDITTITASVRGDAYHAEDLPGIGTAQSGRALPQIAANWRMPFVNDSRTLPQLIEPVAMVAASPNGGNPRKIPNEDSIGFELDELNVFRPNRMPGLDRVEGGVRGAYGLRWHAYPSSNSSVNATVAQGWRAHDDNTFGQGSGFDDNLSDYLGRLDIRPSSYLALLNRIRLDRKNGEIKHTENTLTVGSPMLSNSLTYLLLEPSTYDDTVYNRRHYIAYSVQSALTRNWSATASIEYDLTDDEGGPIGWAGKLTYDDECFAFVSNLRHNYTYDRDYKPGYEVTFSVVFKTLGDVPVNVF